MLGLIGRDVQFDLVDIVAAEDLPAVFDLAGTVVEEGFDLRIVCRELARLMRDLMVVKIDPRRVEDPEIAAEGERDRLTALAARFSREDLLRAFDLLARTEYEIKGSSQPRHHFEMALVKWIHLRQLTPLSELIAGLESGGASMPVLKPAAPAAARPAAARAARAPESRPAPAPAPGAGRPNPKTAEAQKARTSDPSSPRAQGASDPKSALLAAVRERSRVFFSMVVAQAKSVEVEGDAVVFTFAPAHKTLRTEFERQRGWIEELAKTVGDRPLKVATQEAAPAPAPPPAADPDAERKADLAARAKAEPAVQTVLDVFGGTIEDVEEIK